MRTSHVITSGVSVVVGVFVGAAGMYSFLFHQARESASLDQPASSASSRATPTDIFQTSWITQGNTDPITGKVTWYMAGMSSEFHTTLIVKCTKKAGDLSVSFYGDGLYPGRDPTDTNSYDYYKVDYRFDDQPGVTNELWSGIKRSANVPDSVKFIRSLSHSHKLILQFRSEMMDVTSDATKYQHFSLAGFDRELEVLRTHCAAQASDGAT